MICCVSQVRRDCGSERDPQYLVDFSVNDMQIYLKRLERVREDAPVLQPEHSLPLPQATESDPNQEAAPPSFSLMQEGGRIELHRVSARLTAYKAVSSPNGLRLPYQCLGDRGRNRTGWTARARSAPFHTVPRSLGCSTTMFDRNLV